VEEEKKLPLALLMLLDRADDATHDLALTVSAEHETALGTDRFAGGANFHGKW